MFRSLLGPTVIRKKADSLQCRWLKPLDPAASSQWTWSIDSHWLTVPSEVKRSVFHQSPPMASPTSNHIILPCLCWVGTEAWFPWASLALRTRRVVVGKREKAISLSARSSLSVVLLWSRWRLRSPQDPTDDPCWKNWDPLVSPAGIDYELPLGQQYPSRGMESNLLLLGRWYRWLVPFWVSWHYRVEGREELESRHLFPYGCIQKTCLLFRSLYWKPLDCKRAVTVA